MKKLITYFILASILLSMPMKANAATNIRDEGVTETRDEGVTVTSKLVGKTSYVPTLTKKQKAAFNDKYDPVKIKKREEARKKKEEKEWTKKKRKDFEYLVKENILTIQSGDNYILYTYWKPDKTIMRNMSSDINHGNTKENPYSNKKNITSLKKKITKTLKSHDLSVPIKVSIVPYANADFSNGLITYDEFKKFNGEYGRHIVLFNNSKVSMKKQFEIQFNAYLKELQ